MDAWIAVVAAVLIVAVPFDIYTAIVFTAAAWQRPHYRILTLAALRSIAIAIAATFFGLLGVQSIYFAATGERFLPSPIPTILIALGAIMISLPNVYALRWLRGSDRKGEP